jgi:glycine cleavage system H protein
MKVLYTVDHEWIALDDAGVSTVGITAHAQDALGDVVFVDLPTVGTTVAKGDNAAVVESVKAAADVKSPMSGEVVEVNEALRADPSLANSDPMGQGWFYKLRVSQAAEAADLMDSTGYDDLLKTL